MTLRTLTIAAALIISAAPLALAQNGQPTGSEPPVAGGANGNPVLDKSGTAMHGSMHKKKIHKTMKPSMKSPT